MQRILRDKEAEQMELQEVFVEVENLLYATRTTGDDGTEYVGVVASPLVDEHDPMYAPVLDALGGCIAEHSCHAEAWEGMHSGKATVTQWRVYGSQCPGSSVDHNCRMRRVEAAL